MRTKILLTGGSGFIGRNIIESLGSSYTILAPSSKELNLNDWLAAEDYLKKNSIDVIIHAALSGQYKKEEEKGRGVILGDNLLFFFNLVRAKKYYQKLIFFGSGAQYDKSQALEKVKETDLGKSIPADEYGLFKYIGANFANNINNCYCLTLFGVYGKYEDYRSKFISNAIVKNLLKQEIVINQNVVFDYLFINDLIPVLNYCLTKTPKHRIYNVVPDQSIDLVTICQLINEVSDFKSEIKTLNSGFNKSYTASNIRLKKEVKDIKFTDYKKGIAQLYNNYKVNLDNLDKDAILKDTYLKSLLKNKKI